MAIFKVLFDPIDDGPFLGLLTDWGDQKGPLPKICLTYPAMMTLRTVIPYRKKIQNNI